MAASGQKPKSCNDNNDINPNQNWKSTAFTTLSMACVLADEYLLPYFFPTEALAAATMTATYENSTTIINYVSAGFGALSGVFRRKEAIVVPVNDHEAQLLSDADAKAHAGTHKWKLLAETSVPALVGALAATSQTTASTVDRLKLGGKVAMGVNLGLQAVELLRYGFYRWKDTPMVTDDHTSAPPSPEGTPEAVRRKQSNSSK